VAKRQFLRMKKWETYE